MSPLIISYDNFYDYNLAAFIPAVNFTNLLRAAFMLVDPERVKKIDNLTVFYNAFGICKHISCT